MKTLLVLCFTIGIAIAEESAPQILANAVEAMHQARVKREEDDSSLSYVCEIADGNNNGHITKEELISFLERYGQTITPAVEKGIDIMFGSRMFDWNGNGTFECDEFIFIVKMGLAMG